MNKFKMAVCFFIFIGCNLSQSAFSTIRATEQLAYGINQTYAYYVYEMYHLDKIGKKFPSLYLQTKEVKNNFVREFLPSIDNMTNYISKFPNLDAEKFKQKIYSDLDKKHSSWLVDQNSALGFLEMTKEEIGNKKKLPENVLKTLLIFNPKYETQPEMELKDGYSYKYVSNTPKTKGLTVSLDLPISWTGKDSSQPHVIQSFRSQNGQGWGEFHIIVANLPIKSGDAKFINEIIDTHVFTEEELREMIYTVLPDKKATDLKNVGTTKLNNHPAVWFTSIHEEKKKIDIQGKNNIPDFNGITEKKSYLVFYDDKRGMLIGSILTKINGKEIGPLFSQYEKLFDTMASSIIIHNK
ncbi:hypothetical protein [Lonepinella sp. BR2474]|uniref:hypothetical protein n=1 Tax=Lonepinella sp. BR2474 TaxID=3434548 RepID=UPI003F6DB94B